jgi:DNA processing protein
VQLAEDLAGRGITIVSGLARGIDGAAHEGALRVGGATIGVLGCGVDVTYPREHRGLQQQVQRDGLLLAEAPMGTPPEGRGFPKRNRIVSGLALAVIVVEAPQRSGALMTARLAREQGRDVFAVPGEITNPRCAGCLALLRDGAGLVRTAQDVIDELEVHLPQAASAEAVQLSPGGDDSGVAASGATLLDALTSGEHGVESLARQVGQSIDVVQQALLRLELSGHVVRLPGQRYARAS